MNHALKLFVGNGIVLLRYPNLHRLACASHVDVAEKRKTSPTFFINRKPRRFLVVFAFLLMKARKRSADCHTPEEFFAGAG
jgi:hypothetical protein